jgi:hypothetical protein
LGHPEDREGVSRETGTLLNAADEFSVVVRFAKPFGLLVESDSGVQGLVRDDSAAIGATVRVIEFDAAESRQLLADRRQGRPSGRYWSGDFSETGLESVGLT